MVFSSTIFLFFFLPAVLLGYYLIRAELRNAFLLVMSLLFYAVGEPRFVFVMMASIAANYLLGLCIWRARDAGLWVRRALLIATMAVDLGILFYYKYYDFTIANIDRLTGAGLPLRHIALPIGISFFTFQGMSYVLDVYMGKSEVQKDPLNVALYVALFPQLIAGPIVRYSDVAREIVSRKETLDDFASGVQRFAVGLAKKVILSNQFALLADQAFGTAPESLGAGLAWLGAMAYTFQIYFDFSGYSDMAIGLGRMFGFHFQENFDYPYTSDSVTVFWRKWHISLSSWFRDYVYIPLGGNRRGNVYLHLLAVFFLTGLWHGASWNFVVWGLWHGAFLIGERLLRGRSTTASLPLAVRWIYTMLVVVVGWVFFRAADLSAALEYLKCMAGASGAGGTEALYAIQDYGVTFAVGAVAMLPLAKGYRRSCGGNEALSNVSRFLEPLACGALLLVGIAYTVSSTYDPFIYFNF